MNALELHSVTLIRDGRSLLLDVDLSVPEGERVAVLGPLGSGKSMLLRTIAGVERLTSGEIRLAGQDVTQARDRDVAMVDQQATLLPHLDVAQNLAFPLRVKGLPDDEIENRVQAESNAFSLRHLLSRHPRMLSQGERHEVALARALLRRSSLLLIDEPFLSTDPIRRARLLRELVAVQAGYGIALVFATNDPHIAMSLADRMLVLDRGRGVQVGSPRELFDRPANVFIAGCLGDPPMNLIEGAIERSGGRTVVHVGDWRIPSWSLATTSLPPQAVSVGIRSSDLLINPGDRALVVPAVVEHQAFLGDMIALSVTVIGHDRRLDVRCPRPAPEIGEMIRLGLRPDRVHLFDGEGQAIAHGV